MLKEVGYGHVSSCSLKQLIKRFPRPLSEDPTLLVSSMQ